MQLRTFIIASISISVLGSAAGAQSGPDCHDLQSVGAPGVLYYIPGPTNVNATTRWAPLPAVIEQSAGSQDLQLAYIVPTKHNDGETGALVVKITRTNPANSTTPDLSNFRIKLFRPAITTTCKGRYFTDYIHGSGDLYRPEVNDSVYVADYIYYHKTQSDAGQSTIYGFHFDYRDRAGRCVSTDDKRNGNRQQFLYDDRERDNSLVIANIKENLGTVANAFAAPDYLQEMLKDKRLAALFHGYLQYGQLETQLYQYKYPDNACVAITVRSLQKDDTIRLTLNNIEQRGVNGRFLSASSRTEKTVTVKIH
jgi:hypothetical protein